MCECISWCGLELLDAIVSFFILLLNGVCAIWGFILPHSSVKQDIEQYTKTLEAYVSVVSYSDAVLIPLKLVLIVLMKACLCNCERCTKRMLDTEDVIKDNKFRDVSNVCSDLGKPEKRNIIIYQA